MSSVDGYGVQKEGQEETKFQKEIETVEVERVRAEKRVCWRGLITNLMLMKTGVVWKESCEMLRVKFVVTLKANPGILKHGDGIKMWMWLFVEREIYLGFGNRVGMKMLRE